MKRLSLGHWLLILFGLLCLAVGLLAIYPQIPLSWYPRLHPMPSVEEVLASPSDKPVGLTITHGPDDLLCGVVNFSDLFAASAIEIPSGNYTELATAWAQLEAHLTETTRWIIDGRSGFPHLFVGLLIAPRSNRTICADVSSFAPGQYVAQFSFETPLDETYSYTWVFERTTAGVIPEVTAS